MTMNVQTKKNCILHLKGKLKKIYFLSISEIVSSEVSSFATFYTKLQFNKEQLLKVSNNKKKII